MIRHDHAQTGTVRVVGTLGHGIAVIWGTDTKKGQDGIILALEFSNTSRGKPFIL